MRITSKLLILLAGTATGAGAMTLAPRLDELIGTRVVKWGDLRTESTATGTVRRYFDAPTSTLLRLGLRATTLTPGTTPHPVRPHTRANEAVILVREGTLDVQIDSVTQRLEAGSAVFLGPNQWHALRNSSQQPVSYYEMDWVSPGMNGERPYWPEDAGPRERAPRP